MTLTAGLTVFSSDLAAARSFYEGILAMDVLETRADAFVVSRAGLELTVEGGARPRKRGRRWMEEAGVYVTLRTADWDRFHRDLVARGATFLGDVAADSDGKRYAGLADPDGLLIEIAER